MNNESLPELLLIALQKMRICSSASITASRFVGRSFFFEPKGVKLSW
jgi:hypothetical protein